jgi:nitroreductase
VSASENAAASPFEVLARIVTARRSVRGFKPTPVPVTQLREIFEIAQGAPSNYNLQPWLVHVVSGDALERLRAALLAAFSGGNMQPDFPFITYYPAGIYKERQNDSARKLYGAMGIPREDKAGRMAALARNYEFFGAPHAAFVFLDESLGLREAADCGIYAQTLMLALTARGIASCPQVAVSFCAPTVREHLGIPASQKMLLGISFGYEDETVPANNTRIGRCALEECVKFYE